MFHFPLLPKQYQSLKSHVQLVGLQDMCMVHCLKLVNDCEMRCFRGPRQHSDSQHSMCSNEANQA